MFEKLKSRKLWAAFVTSSILFFADPLGIPPDSAQWIAGIVASYIIGQGIADAGAGKSQTSEL
jgi:hypothetical protein